jgi:hypothetical protein
MLSPEIAPPGDGLRSHQSTPVIFDPETAQVLLQVFRVMYPHDALDDSCYRHVVHELASKTLIDRALADLIEKEVSVLIDQYHWVELSEGDRLEALKQIENSPFFRAIRSEFIIHFYGNPLVWKFLGYEGPSNDLGGYCKRGFDDIDWLASTDPL